MPFEKMLKPMNRNHFGYKFSINLNLLLFLILTGINLAGLTGCRKSNNQIPYVPVDVYVQVSLPQYSSLNVIGGWSYISGGSKGIILYRQTTEQFMAYDRHCTYQPDNPCGAGQVDSSNLFVSCNCDGSKYQLYDGAVIEGPATFGLQQYQTLYDEASNTVRVYN